MQIIDNKISTNKRPIPDERFYKSRNVCSQKPSLAFYLLIILLATNFFACKNDFENYSNNPQDLLSFSVDTLSFDTVLTTVNSPVLAFRVYNRNAKPLLISAIRLAEGANSNFKINVDGMAGTFFENVEILAKDSLLVLVDVKPKENGKYTPTLFYDYVVFDIHNIQQKVVLEACGQDVYTCRGTTVSADSALDNQKPYLIYDSLVIDKGATVEIGEGSVFYMYNNAQLIVRGTIKIKGSVEKPVVFRGSRTDYMVTVPYDLIPGQWGGIRFTSDSYDNELENVRIRNAAFGVDLAVSDPQRNKLSMKNVVLTNVSGTLLRAVNCRIVAENCEFSNAKNALLYLVGGSHRFTHCTIANYYPSRPDLGWGASENETLFLSDNNPEDVNAADNYFPVIGAEFSNSIFWGGRYSSSSAIRIVKSAAGADIPYLFKNCLIPNAPTADARFVDCLFQLSDSLSQKLFRKTDPNDFEKNVWYPSFDFGLQEKSPARNVANLEIATQTPYDLNGFSRLADGHPDLGAYEYHEKN